MSVVSVPASDAPLPELMRFATTTYFGYDRHGGVEGLGALASPSIEQWRQSRSLPSSVQLIRASLFFESRRRHHYGYPPDDEAEAYSRALVERLQLVSGGTVKADGESIIWRIRRRLRRPRTASADLPIGVYAAADSARQDEVHDRTPVVSSLRSTGRARS